MKTIISRILKLHEIFVKAVVFFSCFSMLIVCFAQVFCRCFLDVSIVWSDEYCRLAFFITIFFGSALCFLERKHIVVDIIANMLPRKVVRYLSVFNNTASIVFCIFLAVAGYNYAIANTAQVTPCLSIPLFYVYIMIPFACVLMIISILRAAYQEFFFIYADDNEPQKSRQEDNTK